MSFSYDLKKQICDIKVPECCRRAVCYGMMLFGHFLKYDKISVLTDNPFVQKNFEYLIKKCFAVTPTLSSSNGKRPMYKAEITDPEIISFIFLKLGITGDNFINEMLLKRDCCRDAFIRGAFLSCGQISDPSREYRLEFRVKNAQFADFLYEILSSRGVTPKRTKRSGADILYYKNSEHIEDLVTIMGAGNITLQIIDLKILKEVRNNINRKNNVDDLNSTKTIEASITQRSAIKYLIDSEKFDVLADDLKEIALLRMANPEASLTELSRLCSVSISKSGLNHRLKKIVEIADNFKNGK